MNIKRTHYCCGMIIAPFIALHLLNHLTAVFGITWHLEFMEAFRLLYRNLIVETVLFCVLLVQLFTGIKLVWYKSWHSRGPFEKLQVCSGMYLAIFFPVHVGAVLAGRLLLHLDTNIYFGVAGLNTYPYFLIFIPYYGLAMMSVYAHLAAVHHHKMKRTVFGISVAGQSRSILVIGLVLTTLTFYGLTNHFKSFAIPKAYQVLIGR